MSDNQAIALRLNPAISLKSDPNRLVNEKREEMAKTFEKLFAKHLVEEMTKNTFKNNEGSPASFSHYRDHITDTLAGEMAAQEKLGMAAMLRQHWNLE
jgi:Rod binding domain-containing protein